MHVQIFVKLTSDVISNLASVASYDIAYTLDVFVICRIWLSPEARFVIPNRITITELFTMLLSTISGTGAASSQKLTSGPLTFEIVPFHAYAALPALMPILKFIL
jgi:hypothetical protein